MGLCISHGIGIPFQKFSQSWSSYWSPQSAVVENAAPTDIVLTYAKKVNPADAIVGNFSVAGKTISSATLDDTGKILTLVVTTAFTPGVFASILFTNGSTIDIVNNTGYLINQYLVKSAAISTDEMELTTGWSTSGVSDLSINSSEFISGSGSLKVTSNNGVNAYIQKQINWQTAANLARSFMLRIYPHSEPGVTFSKIRLYLAKEASVTNYFYLDIGSTLLKQNSWNLISTLPIGLGQVGSVSYLISDIRIEIFTQSGKTAEISFDLMESGALSHPSVLLMFDDLPSSVYNIAYPELDSRRMVGTLYAISGKINTSGYLTATQFMELYSKGYDVGNHSKDFTEFTSLTKNQIIDNLQQCEDALLNLNMPRATRHVAYPGGGCNSTVLDAMTEWGAKTGRGGILGTYYNRPGMFWPYRIEWGTLPSLSVAKLYIDRMITSNLCSTFVFHTFSDGGSDTSTNWTKATFISFLDYLVEKSVKTITIDEFYRLNTSSVLIKHE